MAGRPRTRERLLSAEAAVQDQAKDYDARLQRIHTNLIRLGIEPNQVDTDAQPSPVILKDYDPGLPLAIMRLAGTGQGLEEIREQLGFSEGQERAWSHQYVDFAAAVSRARAREEAFWYRQQRLAASAGDRTSVASIGSLIAKKFLSHEAQGDASDMLHIRAKRLDQQVQDDD